MPLLLLLFMGIINFGYMIYKSNLINNVARDAAREASLAGTYDDISDVATTELASLGINGASVTITCSNSGTSCGSGEANYDANATSGSKVSVNIAWTYQWITPVGSMCSLFGGRCVGNTMPLSKTAEMVRE